MCWFNAQTTAPGLDALGWYHEKKDEARGVGLGPEHDWASHGADAFGLLAICAESAVSRDIRARERASMASREWMAMDAEVGL